MRAPLFSRDSQDELLRAIEKSTIKIIICHPQIRPKLNLANSDEAPDRASRWLRLWAASGFFSVKFYSSERTPLAGFTVSALKLSEMVEQLERK